jgi:hypothetical protein
VSPDGKYFFFASARGSRAPQERMSYDKLLGWLRGPRNGLGDIYRVDLSTLPLRPPAKTPAPDTRH